jgi:hypothetical protein
MTPPVDVGAGAAGGAMSRGRPPRCAEAMPADAKTNEAAIPMVRAD